MYSANTGHSLFPELSSMVQKVMGIDQVVDSIVNRIGNLEAAYLIGDYADGKDTGIIDLVLVGEIDSFHLNDLTKKTENYINRKVRTLVFRADEFNSYIAKLKKRAHLLIYDRK
jgi:hypothetical protein